MIRLGVAVLVSTLVTAAATRAAWWPESTVSDSAANAAVFPPQGLPPFTPQPLTAFQRAKAEGYLRDRLPCLGCHALNGEGGRLAPDLATVADRLAPEHIRAMIANPAGTRPGVAMPRHPMLDDRLDLLANYLAALDGAGAAPFQPVGGWQPIAPPPAGRSGAALYAQYCAACHGAGGRGDGPNARFLPVTPTAHADSAAMSLRPDDTLYDGIYAGGHILRRHHRMPGFGQLLAGPEIRRLVEHIRSLCRCEGPAWSRDGSTR